MDLRSRVVIWVLAALVISFGFERGADAEQTPKMLYVDVTHPKAQLFGSCSSPQVPCRRITDALARARVIRFEQMQKPGYSEDTVRPIVIEVEPGDYVGTYGPNPNNVLEDLPLLLNVPKVTIRGKTVMNFDASGLPVSVVDDTRTTVRSQETLSAGQFLVGILQTLRNSDGTITLGNGAGVENLVIRPGGGPGVKCQEVRGVAIRHNLIGDESGPLQASGTLCSSGSGTFEGNLYIHNVLGAGFAGGPEDSPSDFVFQGNRSLANSSGSIFVGGSVDPSVFSTFDLGSYETEFTVVGRAVETLYKTTVVISGNDLSDNTDQPGFSFGIRIATRFDMPGGLPGNVTATIWNNTIAGNQVGIMIDAGFPRRIYPPFSGELDIVLSGNSISDSNTLKASVSFNRTFAANIANWKYLQDTTYTISDPDLTLQGAPVEHPATDPLDGRVLNNRLYYNGVVIPEGATLL
jgi:hypothetical protein